MIHEDVPGSGDRSIPARAGNTKGLVALEWALAGSSPHARGIRRAHLDEVVGEGLIPARTGDTQWVPQSESVTMAHPRTRGEHTELERNAKAAHGSSPHARGTRAAGGWHCPGGGLIPARAGNTGLEPKGYLLG